MALNDILTSMDGARDALVTAINAKGGSLAQDSTLYQCADAVGSLSGGTSAEYYKCASVTPGVSGAVIEVTGDTAYGCNGTYTIVDATATGKNRTWRTSDGVWEIRNTNATAGIDRWCIFDVASDTFKIRSVMPTVPDNPWEVTSWQNNTSPYAYPDLVLTPYDTAKTWSGYKAVQQENGGYTFEETVTTGLTYTTITPVVDSIYSADCMILVGYMVPADTAEIPTADLFYYLPLKTDIVTDTGATTYADTGTLTFTTEQGIQCALFDGSQFLRTTNVTDQNNMTVSFWAKKTISDYGAVIGNAYNFQVYLANNVFAINVNSTGNSVDGIDTMVWHHYAVTRSGNDWTFYVDGVKLAIKTINERISVEGNYMRIGNHGYSSSYGRLHAYLTSLRIYYATLNESEIMALAKEFTPTT